jgi:hypothetical protein
VPSRCPQRFIEVGGGEITIDLGTVPSPDLVAEGGPPLVPGGLSRMLELAETRHLGLRTEGSTTLLRWSAIPAPELASLDRRPANFIT